MKNQFDELAKGLAQSVTRRAALKRFGVGLAGMALAVLGLANNARAGGLKEGDPCTRHNQCGSGLRCLWGICRPPMGYGLPCETNRDCMKGLVCRYSAGGLNPGGGYYCLPN